LIPHGTVSAASERQVIAFPVHLITQGRHWKPTLVVGALTAALVALDPHDTPYFRNTTAFHGFNNVLSGTNTGLAMVAFPVAFYVGARMNTIRMETNRVSGVEAMADVQILAFGMQMISRRIRPLDVLPHGNYADTWFEAGLLDRKSFPSAHTITAFALADVFTERYPKHKWVPWVSYGLASTIGFSRLTAQAHFPSDIVAGAVLGFVVSHYLVLHHLDR
jgi:membrane-associated phospholipid phosphatase